MGTAPIQALCNSDRSPVRTNHHCREFRRSLPTTCAKCPDSPDVCSRSCWQHQLWRQPR
jgi:hypothetical protein